MQMFRADGVDHIGKSLEPFYPSRDEYLRIGAAVAQAVGQGRHFENRAAHAPCQWRSVLAFLSGRAVVANDLRKAMVWVVMDISARKELEEKLRESTGAISIGGRKRHGGHDHRPRWKVHLCQSGIPAIAGLRVRGN